MKKDFPAKKNLSINNKEIEIYKPFYLLKGCDNKHIILDNMVNKSVMQKLWSQNSCLCSHISNNYFLVGVC